MNAIRRRGRSVAAGALLASCGLALIAPGAGAITGPTTLTFTVLDKGATSHFLDNPPKITPGHGGEAVSPGDELLGTNPIAIEGKVVGKIRMVCTATSSGTVENAGFICSGVAKIPGGRLFLEGEVVQGPNEGAITGGTGAYAGARGTFLSRHGKGGSTTVVTLLE